MIEEKTYYCIQNDDGDYWNNTDGWTEYYCNADIFESKGYNLPIGGYWVELE